MTNETRMERDESRAEFTLKVAHSVELCVRVDLGTNAVKYVVYDPEDCDPQTGRNFREFFTSYAEALEVYEEHVSQYEEIGEDSEI